MNKIILYKKDKVAYYIHTQDYTHTHTQDYIIL